MSRQTAKISRMETPVAPKEKRSEWINLLDLVSILTNLGRFRAAII